jgi:capsular exopolysaccharide synthesis family protein
MSDIFDALQRSEGERTGVSSPHPTQAAELLRRAERRAASKWESTALVEAPESTEGEEQRNSLPLEQRPSYGSGEEPPARAQNVPNGMASDFFAQFPTQQALATAQNRLVCFTDGESAAAEAFRLLGVRLRDLRRNKPLKKMLITSTIPQEGKSMVSANLACTLALKAPQNVLLIEGDLRRPSLSQMFGVASLKGLSEWLQDEHSEMPSIYHIEGPEIWLLPAGKASRNALELLQSAMLPSLMERLSPHFDWIVIDSPPVLPLADTSVWTRLADGILLVTRQGTTEKRQLQKGVEAIDRKKFLGALLNCSSEAGRNGYYYYRQPSPAAE